MGSVNNRDIIGHTYNSAIRQTYMYVIVLHLKYDVGQKTSIKKAF